MNKEQLEVLHERLSKVIKYFTMEEYSKKTENFAFIELGALHCWVDLMLQDWVEEEKEIENVDEKSQDFYRKMAASLHEFIKSDMEIRNIINGHKNQSD